MAENTVKASFYGFDGEAGRCCWGGFEILGSPAFNSPIQAFIREGVSAEEAVATLRRIADWIEEIGDMRLFKEDHHWPLEHRPLQHWPADLGPDDVLNPPGQTGRQE